MAKARIPSEAGEVLPDDPRGEETPEDAREPTTNEEKLVQWVIGRVFDWKEHRNGNYGSAWDDYERMWRGIYDVNTKSRKSERSKLVSPATSEAVENSAAEIEEAVFNQGNYFSMTPEASDSPIDKAAFMRNRERFREDLARTRFTGEAAEVVLLSAVYGTGAAEIVMTTETRYDMVVEPAPVVGEDGEPMVDEQGQPMMKPQMRSVERVIELPVLRAISPRNLIPDPNARNIDEGLGVAIEEDVPSHIINDGIKRGDYLKRDVQTGSGDSRTKADPQGETPYMEDHVPVIRYYGLVPRHLLESVNPSEDEEQEDDPLKAEMVEAWVVVANESHLLLAQETPEMNRDRPVLAYAWDVVPGRFWGRGICEKGSTPQKLLDAELRSRVDALAFVSAPMMAMDASRLPRGFKLEVYPGKNVLLAGNPQEILKPFKFGELDANSAEQVNLFDQMVQRATGAIDSQSLAQAGAGGQARTGAVSISMAGVVKRNKRTLARFVDNFLGPALRKMFWRCMQYNPDRYAPINTTFNVASTMGIMQREYETQALAQLMGSMSPGTSEHLMLLIAFVNNSGINSRDEIVASLRRRLQQVQQQEQLAMQAAVQPEGGQQPVDPLMQQIQQAAMQLQLVETNAKIAKLVAETDKLRAETRNEALEPMFKAQELALRGIYKTPEEQMDGEFDRRLEVARLMLDEKQMESDERITAMQMAGSAARQAPQHLSIAIEEPVISPVPMERA